MGQISKIQDRCFFHVCYYQSEYAEFYLFRHALRVRRVSDDLLLPDRSELFRTFSLIVHTNTHVEPPLSFRRFSSLKDLILFCCYQHIRDKLLLDLIGIADLLQRLLP